MQDNLLRIQVKVSLTAAGISETHESAFDNVSV